MASVVRAPKSGGRFARRLNCVMALAYGLWLFCLLTHPALTPHLRLYLDFSLDLLPLVSQCKDVLTMTTGVNPITQEAYTGIDRSVLLLLTTLPFLFTGQRVVATPSRRSRLGRWWQKIGSGIYYICGGVWENFCYCLLSWGLFSAMACWQSPTTMGSKVTVAAKTQLSGRHDIDTMAGGKRLRHAMLKLTPSGRNRHWLTMATRQLSHFAGKNQRYAWQMAATSAKWTRTGWQQACQSVAKLWSAHGWLDNLPYALLHHLMILQKPALIPRRLWSRPLTRIVY